MKQPRGLLAQVALRLVSPIVSLYPLDFRARHGQSLHETLRDQVRSALQENAAPKRWTSVLAELADAALGGLRMRMRPSADQPASQAALARAGRGQKGASMFESLAQDLRFALRGLIRQPGFAAAAIAVLAVGIGLNTTVFSLVNAYLLRPLPFPESERLMSVAPLPRTSPREDWIGLPREVWASRFPAQDEVIESLVAWDLDLLTLVGEEDSLAVEGAWVTPGYFDALGTQAHLGRVFTQEDAAPDRPVVAVISYGLWQSRFGGDPEILGQPVSVFAGDRPDDAQSLTIVGVLPRDFWFMNRFTGILPILKEPGFPSLVKLRPGVGLAQARQHFTSIVQSQASMPEDWQVHVQPAQEAYVFSVKPVLRALSGAVALVLLLACANVAILLLVRAMRRHRELVVRLALGASRARLMRLMLVEGLALSLVAGVLGIVLGWLTLRTLSPLLQAQLRTAAPGGMERMVELHPTVLALSVGAALVTGLLFTLAPALAASGLRIASALSSGGRSAAGGRRHHYLRSGLIVAEVALSLTLLIGAALMVRSANHLSQVDVGFQAQDVLTVNLSLSQESYPGGQQQVAFVDQFLPRVRSLPEIEAAGIQASWPFQDQSQAPVLTRDAPDSGPTASWYVVSPGHLEALRVPLLRGRRINDRDLGASQPVVVVSRSLADNLWPGEDPLGKQIRYQPNRPINARMGEENPWRTVVGVVGDVRETLTGRELPDCYVPYRQSPRLFMFLNVRYRGTPEALLPALRQALYEVDSTAAVHRMNTMQDLVDRARSRPRFLAGMLGGFSVFAVALALLGLGSLIAFTVSQRRHEIAVRMALGAAPGQVRQLFMRQGGRIIAVGMLTGILLGTALTGALASQLYGVRPLDWPTFAAAALLLTAAALSAVWLSARRAEKTDPTSMLKQV
ncbi:MAG TPA: ABC transporter permease [Acidobacteriota bacterium]|nr:ABC transporter permease [Acidobacteriota bacterium]